MLLRSWFQLSLPTEVRPSSDPSMMNTVPAPASPPRPSPGAPMAASQAPSLLKSPAATAAPKRSFFWLVSGTPSEFCDQLSSPLVVNPDGLPKNTWMRSVFDFPPRTSPGTPTMMSAKPSLLRSPLARLSPKRSPGSLELRTPELSWWKTCAPTEVRPAAEPYTIVMLPVSLSPPIRSPGAPIAMSE